MASSHNLTAHHDSQIPTWDTVIYVELKTAKMRVAVVVSHKAEVITLWSIFIINMQQQQKSRSSSDEYLNNFHYLQNECNLFQLLHCSSQLHLMQINTQSSTCVSTFTKICILSLTVNNLCFLLHIFHAFLWHNILSTI